MLCKLTYTVPRQAVVNRLLIWSYLSDRFKIAALDNTPVVAVNALLGVQIALHPDI